MKRVSRNSTGNGRNQPGRRSLHVLPKRACGTCTACCTVLGVPELEKAPGRSCSREASGKGCSTYESRPASCKGYKCMWLEGLARPYDRPDRIGVVFSAHPTKLAVTAHELRPSAFESVDGRAAIDFYAKAFAVILVKGDELRKVIGHEPSVRAVLRDAEERAAKETEG